MSHIRDKSSDISRRRFLQAGTAASAALVTSGALWPSALSAKDNSLAAKLTLPLDRDWLFGGRFDDSALAPAFNDASFARVTVPHCVAKLSWQKWDPASWQDVWVYRRHFTLPPEFKGKRIFVQFDGVLVVASPVINGHALPKHSGGYLPARYEITDWVQNGDNVLAVGVDSRWLDVPPDGSPKGTKAVDYLEPGGIFRSVRLQAAPTVYISDVFAKPVDVTGPSRRIEVACSIDAAAVPAKRMRVRVELKDGWHVVSKTENDLVIDQPGQSELNLALTKLGNAQLWELDAPKLYDVVATLFVDGRAVHEYRTRTGIREAHFDLDGFSLNGRRVHLFGLDRHEIFPYVGEAIPPRVARKDAEILRHEFNCNIVRCSHYPQSEAFLDACDEMGLMVWEETPGWQYLGDDAFKELVVQNVHDMIVRDRNHPSIVIWGVRVNESANSVELYKRTTALAKSLDDSRATSGSMTGRKNWETEWKEDVFAMDDYHAAPDGSVAIDAPIPGVPYMLAETVGQFSYDKKKGFDAKYRRAGDVEVQQAQALRHAQAHSKAAAFPTCAGAIAWCAFEYASLMNNYDNIKCPGVADVFRIPKLGATFYQAQGDVAKRPVILPNFYWDFGPKTPKGPGKNAAIFSNCDRLEISVGGKHLATVEPDAKNYPNIKHPPFFVDLEIDGAAKPELRIDGYVGGTLVLTRSFSSDPAQDQFYLQADDQSIMADGADATRVVFGQVDRFGSVRLYAEGAVSFDIGGPGVVVGDNPFGLTDSGGMGAVWIKSLPGQSGTIKLMATHSTLGSKTVKIGAET